MLDIETTTETKALAIPLFSDTTAVNTTSIAVAIRAAMSNALENDDLSYKVLKHLFPIGVTGSRQGDQYLASHYLLNATNLREDYSLNEKEAMKYMFQVLRRNGYDVGGGRVTGHKLLTNESRAAAEAVIAAEDRANT